MIEEGLRLRVSARKAPAKTVRLPIYRGKGGLAAGLDGLSNKALLVAASRSLAAAVIHQGEHLVGFDADFKRLLSRSQFTRLTV